MAVAAGLERHLPGRLVGVSASTPRAVRPTAWPCRPASSTSAATRRPPTSAPPRCCWPSSPSMYAVYHGPEGLRAIARAHPPLRRGAGGARCATAGVEVVHGRSSTPSWLGCPGGPADVVAAARDARHPPAAGRRRHVGISCSERTGPADASRRCWRRSGSAGGELDASTAAPPTRCPAELRARHAVPHPRGVQQPPQRDPDAALPAPALGARLRARPGHDPARLVHDEAQRHHRDGAGLPARLRRPAPVRAGRGRRRLPPAGRRARGLAGRGHRLRPGLDPAQRRLAGRARRTARDPRLPPGAQRSTPAAGRLPDPVVRARHQRRVRGDGRHEGGRRQGGRRRRGRPRRPARPVRGARRRPGGDHGDLPVDARRLRGHHHRAVPDRARPRRPGLRRRRQPQRAARLRQARRVRRRRLAPQPAQDVLHPARRRRPRRRPGRGPRAPRAVPALPRHAPRSRPSARASGRSARRRTARPGSCRSRGPTSG